jgi:hypothetical protein
MSAALAFPELEPAAPAAPAALLAIASSSDLAEQQPLTVKAAVLALFQPMEVAQRALAERYRAVVFDVTKPAGLKAAKEARHDLRENGRFQVQRALESAKDALNEAKSTATERADALVAITRPTEDAIDAIIGKREAEIAAEKQREEDRKSAHRQAIATIQGWATQARLKNPPAHKLAEGIATVEAIDVSAAIFEEFADQAAEAKAATLQALRDMHAAAVLADQERAEAERNRRVIATLATIQAHGTACLGRPAAVIRDRLALMESTVYSEDLGQAVVIAHEAQLQQLRTMLAMTEQSETLLAQAEARRAAQADLEAKAAAAAVDEAASSAAGLAPVKLEDAQIIPAATDVIAADAPSEAEAAASPAPSVVPFRAAAPAATSGPPTLTLGAICGRLGFTVSAAFLTDTLHIKPAATDKRAQLYTEHQFATICRQLVSHVSAMSDLYAA